MYAICEDRLENFFEKKGGFYLISVCLNLTSYKEDIKNCQQLCQYNCTLNNTTKPRQS